MLYNNENKVCTHKKKKKMFFLWLYNKNTN